MVNAKIFRGELKWEIAKLELTGCRGKKPHGSDPWAFYIPGIIVSSPPLHYEAKCKKIGKVFGPITNAAW